MCFYSPVIFQVLKREYFTVKNFLKKFLKPTNIGCFIIKINSVLPFQMPLAYNSDKKIRKNSEYSK